MNKPAGSIINVSINAGNIEATGHSNPDSGHQLMMVGNTISFIHIKPDVARQWIGVLETIAEAAE